MNTALITALRQSECYPHPVRDVELLETHISWVLLAGDFAYKIKKPLDLGFLDFSSLEKRRFFCAEELRLNQRTAPDLYLGVVPICGTDTAPRLAGRGQAIEYAVKMRRFRNDAGFDSLLDRAALTPAHVAGLARALGHLHRLADIAAPDSAHAGSGRSEGPIRDNFRVIGTRLPSDALAEYLPALQTWVETQLTILGPALAQRASEGFIRECHGDAHLANVALIDDRATLFDCIEFSESLRWIDVMSDAAFPFMDLHSRGAPRLAALFLDEYLSMTGDYTGLRLLPLYTVYRALVRAKVNAIRLDDVDGDRVLALKSVTHHLELASRISRPRPVALIIMMGLSGSGKSWLARQLVEHLAFVSLRSDVERKRLHGLDRFDRSDSELGVGLYGAAATERTYDHLATTAREVIESGLPALIDAANLHLWQRELFQRLAIALGVPFVIVHCRADSALLRRRIQSRSALADDPSEAGISVLEQQQNAREDLSDEEIPHALTIDTSERDAAERALALVKHKAGV